MASNKATLVNLRNSVISNSSNLGWSSNHQIYFRMGTNQGYSAMFGSNLLRLKFLRRPSDMPQQQQPYTFSSSSNSVEIPPKTRTTTKSQTKRNTL